MLYEHCTGTQQKSKNVFIVYYKNWLDEWTADTEEFTTEAKAKTREKLIKKEKASNGKTTIQQSTKSKKERKTLAKNINKF
jgi:hypothetical protein